MTERHPTRRAVISKMAIAAGLILGAGAVQPAWAQAGRITIGTNPTGSSYYVIGSALASALTEKLGGIAVAQPATGSSVNLPLIASGELTMAVSSSLDGGLFYRGGEGIKPHSSLRTLVRLTDFPYAYLVRENSGLRTIGDLKGKRVAMKLSGNLALESANVAMLASAGLSEKDITNITMAGLTQGLKAVADGTIDAAPMSTSMPIVQELNATVPGGVRILTLDGPNATTTFLSKEVPGLYAFPIEPAPNRPGVHRGTVVTGFDVFLLGSADMPESRAKAVVEALLASWDDMRKKYPQLAHSTVQDLSLPTNAVPYHPGAIAAFKAKGMWSAANVEREQQFGTKKN